MHAILVHQHEIIVQYDLFHITANIVCSTTFKIFEVYFDLNVMGVDVLSVNLDDPTRQYSSGQAVSGKVLLSVSGEETTTEVVVRFLGFAHTHWVEHEHRTRERNGKRETYYETYYYTGHDDLFDMALRLFGDGKNRIQIPPGDNVFPFCFQVPTRPLPVTCSFENGSVQYGLEAKVRKPWYQFDRKTELLPVTIFTFTDLNITPGARLSMRIEDSRVFGCCCCPSQPCFIRSFTPKTGFIPGEVIPCVVEVNNMSNRTVLSLTATFTQLWTLFAYGYRGRHSRTHPIALQSAGHPGSVEPGQGITWEVSFTVPPTVPPTPNSGACDIVNMEYLISISVAMKGCCGLNDFGTSHPVIIGTIPLVPIAIVTAQTPSSTETPTETDSSSRVEIKK